MVAKYECFKCTEKSGDKALAYCESCTSMAEQIHFQLSHSPALVQLTQLTQLMDLAAVVCVQDGHYSAFVKAGVERSSAWLFYDAEEGDSPKVWKEQLHNSSANRGISYCFIPRRFHWNSIYTCGWTDWKSHLETIMKHLFIHC